jgi:formylglycine-generating enzyme required for sulfatase activity
VTFDEYDLFLKSVERDGGCEGGRQPERPGDEGWDRGRRPAINVSWRDAACYAAWLTKKRGFNDEHRYRLPTEAEWEYAARAGTTTRYWWGDKVGKNNANCAGCGSQWDDKQTAPVGSFQPNGFGLHDMLRNVWEWVEDCWHESYEGAPANGSAWGEQQGGDCTRRVIRGGSWYAVPGVVRSAYRLGGTPGYRGGIVGFRLAQDI